MDEYKAIQIAYQRVCVDCMRAAQAGDRERADLYSRVADAIDAAYPEAVARVHATLGID